MKYEKDHSGRALNNVKHSTFSGVVLIAFSAVLAAGCVTNPLTPPDHGGGIGLLNSGELVSIKSDGTLGPRCVVCRAGESGEACEDRANRRDLPRCSIPGKGEYSNAQEQLQLGSSNDRGLGGLQLAASRDVRAVAQSGLTCWGVNTATGKWEVVSPPHAGCNEHWPPKVFIPYCTCTPH